MKYLDSWNTLQQVLGQLRCQTCGKPVYYCYALAVCDCCLSAWNVNPFRK